MLETSPKKEKEDTQSLQTKASQEKNTEGKDVRIEKIIEELPELLVKHAYTKIKIRRRANCFRNESMFRSL